MIPFCAGGIIAACGRIKRNNEEAEKRNLDEEPPKSTIKLNIKDKSIDISFSIQDDFDWARAAWALINACKENGQYDNLQQLLQNQKMQVLKGGFEGD